MAAQRQTPLQYVLWLGVALLAHIMVALFGVMNRFLQVEPSPPLPALRCALLVSLLALATVAAVDGTTRCVGFALRRRRQRRGLPMHQAGPAAQLQPEGCNGVGGGNKVIPAAAAAAAAAVVCTAGSAADGTHATAEPAASGKHASAAATPGDLRPSPFDATAAVGQAAAAAAGQAAAAAAAAGPHPPPCPSASLSLSRLDSLAYQPRAEAPLPPLRPEVALQRGLSRHVRDMERGRPRLVRYGALALITTTFATAYLCQVVAPGFVDPALVQLCMVFTVVGVSLVQWLLLKHTLPRLLWPCAAGMLAGACMVIVPTVGRGAVAGIDGWQGWLGFALSLLSMASTVVYFITLQASRRLGFTSLQLQYLFLSLSIALLLPLSLGIDGTDWAWQFATWGAGDWLALVATASVICVGANFAIQHATWQIGAPTLSMFFGLRIVATIVESKAILNYTIINTPVQIAGTVLTVVSVSIYLVVQWLQSRRAQAAAAAAQLDGTAPPQAAAAPPQAPPAPAPAAPAATRAAAPPAAAAAEPQGDAPTPDGAADGGGAGAPAGGFT